jgi:hypothetical protein
MFFVFCFLFYEKFSLLPGFRMGLTLPRTMEPARTDKGPGKQSG